MYIFSRNVTRRPSFDTLVSTIRARFKVDQIRRKILTTQALFLDRAWTIADAQEI